MAQQPLFRPYTGGIQPLQGQIEAGARIGQMYQQGLSSMGAGLAEGIKEYYKNSALNDQAAAEAEGAAGNLTRMMAMLGQSAEYAPFVQQYAPLLEKAKKAPTMGMSQRLALANELKTATQSLGTDMQLYKLGVEGRARQIAFDEQRRLEGAQVVIGEREIGMPIQLGAHKNVTTQLNSFREKYNLLNERTGGKAGTWFQFLKKQEAQVLASIDSISDEHITAAQQGADPATVRAAMKSNFADYISNEERNYVTSRELTKDITAQNVMAGLAQARNTFFGNAEQQQGARDYFTGLGKRVGEGYQAAQAADQRGLQMSEMASPLQAGVPKPKEGTQTTESAVEEIKQKAVARQSEEDALIGDKRAQQIAYLKGLRETFRNPNSLTNNVSGFLNYDRVTDAILERGGVPLPSIKRSVGTGDNTSISQGQYEDLASKRRDELETLGRRVLADAGLPSAAKGVAMGTLRAIPETIGLVRRQTLTPEQQIKGIKAIDGLIAEIEGKKPEPSAREKVEAIINGTTSATAPTTPRLVPSFGVASAIVGKETIKAEMGSAQKKQAVADYVKRQMGFDSPTIDAVVQNMFPSDGPTIRTVQTAQGMATFVLNEKGGWNQVTGFSTGEKSYGMFGTMTSDGKVAPKVIQSANGGVQIRLAGQFQGPDSAFIKFNDGLVTYLDGMEAAKRLQEITALGAGAAFDAAMRAEGAMLVARIKAAIRTEVVGTGSISDYEQKLIDDVIYNPATFWSLSSANQQRVKGVMEKMNSHLINNSRVWGLNVSTNLQSNSERETQLRTQ